MSYSLAAHTTTWHLNCFGKGSIFVFQYELIFLVFGRQNFGKITANLDVFLRRFNEVQYWVVTEICLTTPVSKRVQLLRKFIKIAA